MCAAAVVVVVAAAAAAAAASAVATARKGRGLPLRVLEVKIVNEVAGISECCCCLWNGSNETAASKQVGKGGELSKTGVQLSCV